MGIMPAGLTFFFHGSSQEFQTRKVSLQLAPAHGFDTNSHQLPRPGRVVLDYSPVWDPSREEPERQIVQLTLILTGQSDRVSVRRKVPGGTFASSMDELSGLETVG
jgi:hypothetical protein